jgi:hypothetical protein
MTSFSAVNDLVATLTTTDALVFSIGSDAQPAPLEQSFATELLAMIIDKRPQVWC